uniref:Uncharacterized protein n=1 Tax=Vespula pensylvanica TaxID=30213 RepID=A0A834JTC9_VESPE|nr:hypothetical protein H0235_017078 [Vespula pensylvanica]
MLNLINLDNDQLNSSEGEFDFSSLNDQITSVHGAMVNETNEFNGQDNTEIDSESAEDGINSQWVRCGDSKKVPPRVQFVSVDSNADCICGILPYYGSLTAEQLTSYILDQELVKLKCYLTKTILTNRKELPNEIKKDKILNKIHGSLWKRVKKGLQTLTKVSLAIDVKPQIIMIRALRMHIGDSFARYHKKQLQNPLVNSKEIVVSGSDVLNERRRITNDKAKTSYVQPLNLSNGIFAEKADTEFKKFKEFKTVDTGIKSTLGHEDATELQRISSSRSNGLKKKEHIFFDQDRGI